MEKKRTRKALKKASKFSDQDFYVQSETCYPLSSHKILAQCQGCH